MLQTYTVTHTTHSHQTGNGLSRVRN